MSDHVTIQHKRDSMWSTKECDTHDGYELTCPLSGDERPAKMQRTVILAPQACPYVYIRDWKSVRGFTVPHTTIDG
jgi:hypothetical protein